MTQDDALIRMAHQIGCFFQSQPDRPQALLDFATHLQKSWTPAMRQRFVALLQQPAGPPVADFVREAVRFHGAVLFPAGAPAPASSCTSTSNTPE